MAEVIWSPSALGHVEEITEYIARFDPAAAARLGSRLFAMGDSLSFFPRRGRPASGGTREITTVRPYILRYEVQGERVTILGIRHGARRPLD